jgi:hypothetical protein
MIFFWEDQKPYANSHTIDCVTLKLDRKTIRPFSISFDLSSTIVLVGFDSRRIDTDRGKCFDATSKSRKSVCQIAISSRVQQE